VNWSRVAYQLSIEVPVLLDRLGGALIEKIAYSTPTPYYSPYGYDDDPYIEETRCEVKAARAQGPPSLAVTA
jgi:hypothetical protein